MTTKFFVQFFSSLEVDLLHRRKCLAILMRLINISAEKLCASPDEAEPPIKTLGKELDGRFCIS